MTDSTHTPKALKALETLLHQDIPLTRSMGLQVMEPPPTPYVCARLCKTTSTTKAPLSVAACTLRPCSPAGD